MQGQLKDRVIIVTGGGHGIGRAYAETFSERGASVVVAELDGEAGKAVAKSISDNGGRALGVTTDITSPRSLQEMAEEAIDAFGRIDVLVNNAAIFSTIGMSRSLFDEIAEDEWDQMLSVNLKGTWLSCKAVVPYMRRQAYGKIVNIASTTVYQGLPTRAHYVAAKAGVIGLTRTLAGELGGANITVNCVAPGSTLSEDNPTEDQRELRERASQKRAISRVQQSADLVGAVAFFSSADSDFITGQTLVVDGGTVML